MYNRIDSRTKTTTNVCIRRCLRIEVASYEDFRKLDIHHLHLVTNACCNLHLQMTVLKLQKLVETDAFTVRYRDTGLSCQVRSWPIQAQQKSMQCLYFALRLVVNESVLELDIEHFKKDCTHMHKNNPKSNYFLQVGNRATYTQVMCLHPSVRSTSR